MKSYQTMTNAMSWQQLTFSQQWLLRLQARSTYTGILFHEICSVMVMVRISNATFNNISVISWQSVLLVGEAALSGDNHWPAAGHCQTLSHKVVWVHLIRAGLELTTLVVIHTDCIVSCKANYYTITATTASRDLQKFILWSFIHLCL